MVALGDVENKEMPSVFLIRLQARHRDRIFEVRMPSGITSVEHLFLQLWKMRPREGQTVSQAICRASAPGLSLPPPDGTASNSYKRDHVSENGPPPKVFSSKTVRRLAEMGRITFFFLELWKLAKVLQ